MCSILLCYVSSLIFSCSSFFVCLPQLLGFLHYVLHLIHSTFIVSVPTVLWRWYYFQTVEFSLNIISCRLVSQVLDPAWLAARYPDNEVFQDPNSFFFKALAGISSGLLYSLFFSILPQIFKALAFFEGTSSSKVKAEEKAMRFYWYFMLVTAFTGSSLVQMLIDGFMKGTQCLWNKIAFHSFSLEILWTSSLVFPLFIYVTGSVGAEFKDILVTVAASIVTQVRLEIYLRFANFPPCEQKWWLTFIFLF